MAEAADRQHRLGQQFQRRVRAGALGDPRGDGAWVVRVHVKPFVFWIWLGAFLMAAGGALAVMDKRYRHKPVLLAQQEALPPTADSIEAVAKVSHS